MKQFEEFRDDIAPDGSSLHGKASVSEMDLPVPTKSCIRSRVAGFTGNMDDALATYLE